MDIRDDEQDGRRSSHEGAESSPGREKGDDEATTDGGSTNRSCGSRKQRQLDIAALVARLQKQTESSRRKQYEQRKEEDKREDHRGKFSPLPPIEV